MHWSLKEVIGCPEFRGFPGGVLTILAFMVASSGQ